MELTKDNLQQTLTSLRDKGLFALVSHIENTLKVNEEEYPEGSTYGTDKGYGVKIYLMKYVNEYLKVVNEFNLVGNPPEIEETIHEENGIQSYYYLHIIGAENAIAIYVIDED